jgi:hypothetical protein
MIDCIEVADKKSAVVVKRRERGANGGRTKVLDPE